MTEALLLRTFPLATFMIKVRYYGVGSVAFKNIRNSILDTLIASTLDGRESVYQKKTPVVHECFLSWCVRTIKSLYDLSEYHKNPLSFFYNSTNGPNTWISRGIPEHQGGGTWIEYKKNITITTLVIDPTHTNYSIEYGSSNVTAQNFMTIFGEFFPSPYSIDNISTIPILQYKRLLLRHRPLTTRPPT
ncbi:hypothetical protein COCSADRAFT_187237 [Bipolaris sorokiniana ND90Pr]|uniref:Uncharacterized protein n=1 Tax=Cochliobolus sativus (strain ND90Pr / ATCC 201652) TaxID=665912 RepID=M2T137_COCSN|nr:uncharacterized protein COCSADRAFT_187237 [Bipolaris sorokiniana ND90Pr]EMD68245.1 hypothetical protein COCSADRAFT_187237 [Bipolaris sorokiniana ND90Pr]